MLDPWSSAAQRRQHSLRGRGRRVTLNFSTDIGCGGAEVTTVNCAVRCTSAENEGTVPNVVAQSVSLAKLTAAHEPVA